jgi:hypothetical protein
MSSEDAAAETNTTETTGNHWRRAVDVANGGGGLVLIDVAKRGRRIHHIVDAISIKMQTSRCWCFTSFANLLPPPSSFFPFFPGIVSDGNGEDNHACDDGGFSPLPIVSSQYIYIIYIYIYISIYIYPMFTYHTFVFDASFRGHQK